MARRRKAIVVIVAVIVGGRFLLRRVFDVIARTDIEEIFTAAALLVVVGVSLLMAAVGLSMSLGAFLAGVLLADSEYRHELEAAIEPFKGLLLGLFFISVGMSVDLSLIVREPLLIIGAVIGLMMIKGLIVLAIAKIAGHSAESTRKLAVVLAQGGEFAFVLFSLAGSYKIMDALLVDRLVVIVTLSMAATPFALKLNDALNRRLAKRTRRRAVRRDRRPRPARDHRRIRARRTDRRAYSAACRRSSSPRSTAMPSRSNRCGASGARSTTAMLRGSTCCGRRRRTRRNCSCSPSTTSRRRCVQRKRCAAISPISRSTRAHAIASTRIGCSIWVAS